MKYIKFIILTTFISCQNNTPKHAESEYAFENMAYKNLDLNKLNNKDSINQIGSINNENSIRKTKQNDSKIDKRSRDSLNRISQYNKDVWINLKEFYQTPSYLPSSKFDHLKHLRKYSTIEHLDEKTNKPKFFVDYVIERHLENPEHVKFLTDRKLLKKLRNVMCDEGYVRIADFLENGKHISITLRSDNLEVENHKITVDEKNNYISEIDGKYPFGAIYYSKSTDEIVELSQIKIQIEGNNLETRIER